MNVNGIGITARLSKIIQPEWSRSCHRLTVAAVPIHEIAIYGMNSRIEVCAPSFVLYSTGPVRNSASRVNKRSDIDSAQKVLRPIRPRKDQRLNICCLLS